MLFNIGEASTDIRFKLISLIFKDLLERPKADVNMNSYAMNIPKCYDEGEHNQQMGNKSFQCRERRGWLRERASAGGWVEDS
ncbi:hypothetical protein Tco_0801095 [Tanacetum coccineum]|uniref:Uncharacterized protein n=1 Tax=Tanacetum coccineum TaxID=301880 RepID=A0ABQ4ZVY2_9ASTR